ncbi:hypothetical protein FOBRF1_011909 [Fusarium oxysporum]
MGFKIDSILVCVQRSQDFHPDVVEPRQADAASSCFLAFLSSGNNGMGEMTLGGIDTSEYEGELKKIPFNETVVSLGGSWYINPANYINRTVTHLLNMHHIFSPLHISTLALHIMAPDYKTAKYVRNHQP